MHVKIAFIVILTRQMKKKGVMYRSHDLTQSNR